MTRIRAILIARTTCVSMLVMFAANVAVGQTVEAPTADGAAFASVAAAGKDCNQNGVDDETDVNSGRSPDCNQNTVPDECEIPKDSQGPGGPFFCLVDCDPDCNSNAIPDACDIVDCPIGEPDCDDCNLNGIPDPCEIQSGQANDINQDGVIDSCSGWSSSPINNLWGVAGNWIPTTIPNNDGRRRFNVTISGPQAAVLLNIDAVIDSLRLREFAVLRVIFPGDQFTPNLKIDTPSGMLIEGRLFVDRDRVIQIPFGDTVIGRGGVYTRDPQSSMPTTATLKTRFLTIFEGEPGGAMRLRDNMLVDVTGDFVLDGSNVPQPGSPAPAVTCTPPILRTQDNATVVVGGDLEVIESADVGVVDDNPGDEPPVQLAGDFINHSTDPTIFDWTEGGLLLSGSGEGNPQFFEVAGVDLGATADGFVDNFAFGAIEVSGSATVIFEDAFDNDGAGQAPCTEALYVNRLTLREGAGAVLVDCIIYYHALINEGADVGTQGVGCAELVPIKTDCNLDGTIDIDDYAAHYACVTGPQMFWSDPECQCADINGDDHVDARDFAALQVAYSAP